MSIMRPEGGWRISRDPVHPGEMLREEFMKPVGISINGLALELHVPEYFNVPPDQLGPEQVREYAAHLFRVRQLSSSSVCQRIAALCFFLLCQDVPEGVEH